MRAAKLEPLRNNTISALIDPENQQQDLRPPKSNQAPIQNHLVTIHNRKEPKLTRKCAPQMWPKNVCVQSSSSSVAISFVLLFVLLLALGDYPAQKSGLLLSAEAKTHHSKRQVSTLDSGPQQQPSRAGRESTNWWNLWWQQYINEALSEDQRPQVRPIVGVAFNGQTIRLPEEQESRELLAAEQQAGRPEREVATESNQLQEQLTNDIERNEQLRLIAMSQHRQTDPRPSRPAQEAWPPSQQSAAAANKNWNLVKPKMIQLSGAANNRQARMEQQETASGGDDEQNQINGPQFGIQMRANLKPQQQQRRPTGFGEQQQQAARTGQELLEQFELSQQQQHQMTDYSDMEAELEAMTGLNGSQPTGGGTETPNGAVDSSSSAMMMPEQPRRQPTAQTTTTKTKPSPRPAATSPSTIQQTVSTSTTTTTTTTTTPEPTTTTTSIAVSRTMATTLVPTPSTTKQTTTRQPVTVGSTSQTKTTTLSPERQTTTTTTPTIASTVSGTSGTPTGRADAETPISTNVSMSSRTNADEQQQSATRGLETDSSKTTRAGPSPTQASSSSSSNDGGRVELMNGRPASGIGQLPTGTTTSARLPTRPSSPRMSTPSTVGVQEPTGSSSPATTPSTAAPTTPSTTITTPTISLGVPRTTTGTPPANTSDKATTLSPADDAAEEEEEEDIDGSPGVSMNNNNNSSDSASSEDDSGDEGEDDDEDMVDQDSGTANTTNTSAGGVSSTTGAPQQPSSSVGIQLEGARAPDNAADQMAMNQQMDSDRSTVSASTPAPSQATTQQPILTTIEIERLPNQNGQDSATKSAGGEAPKADQAARLQDQDSGDKRQKMLLLMPAPSNEPVRMGTLSVDGETPITMPMETLMRMMMLGEQQRQSTTSTTSASSPGQTSTTMTTSATQAPASTSLRTTNGQQSMATGSTPATGLDASGPQFVGDTSLQTTSSGPVRTTPAGGQSEASSAAATKAFEELQTSTTRKKLQPPPTTRVPASMPSTTTGGPANDRPASAIPEVGRGDESGMPPTASAEGLREMMRNSNSNGMRVLNGLSEMMGETEDDATTLNRITKPTTVSSTMSSQAAEPKIELLNMDLVPIQRLMSSTIRGSTTPAMQQQVPTNSMQMQMQMQTQRQQQQLQRQQMQQQQQQQQQKQPLEVVQQPAVEPGMRLRPAMSTMMVPQQQQQQKPTTMSVMVQQTATSVRQAAPMMLNTKAPLQPTTITLPDQNANTVYMIMMSGGDRSISPAANQPFPGLDLGGSTKTASRPKNGKQTPVSSGDRQQQAMTTMTVRQSPATQTSTTVSQQQQQQQQMMTVATRGQPPQMMTSRFAGSGSSSSGKPSTPPMTQTTQSVPLVSSTPATTTTKGPKLTEQTTTSIPPTTIGGVSSTTLREMRQMLQNLAEQSSSSVGSTAAPATTTRPAMSPLTSTTLMNSSPAQTTLARGPERENDSRGGQPMTVVATTISPAVTTRAPQASDKIQQISPGAVKQQQIAAGIKSQNLAKTVGNATVSSFIPAKLRNDFGKFKPQRAEKLQQGAADTPSNQTGDNRQQILTTTTTPAPSLQQASQSMQAIRQFGGANRMSALANGQPMPFGRPATMMIGSLRGSGRKAEVPTFEYGPAISVRRPDEPLANGQMPNCTLSGKNFCVLTKDYPMNEVRQAVERSFRSVRIMYEELQTVSDQELHKENFVNATSSQAARGKFACQTQVEMMRPGWAKDEITKEWMLVVNTDVFPQRVRSESCAQPNTPCEFIAPFYDSTCQQRYSLHRMIAIDPHDPSRSPQVAVFKFPAGCVCRVHPIKKNASQISQMLAAVQAAASASATTTTTTPTPKSGSMAVTTTTTSPSLTSSTSSSTSTSTRK